jgi:hypothetical protein
MNTEIASISQPDTPQQLPANAETAGSDRPNPFEDLKQHGFLDQLLEKTRRSLSGDAGKLHRELTENLSKMREATANPRLYLTRFADLPKEEVPRWLVSHQTDNYRTDSVLRFCLGQRWGIEDKDGELRADALEKYQEQADGYDKILGEIIPADFRKEGQVSLAERNYDFGIHNTAADDWPIYRARLQHRRGRPLVGISSGLPSLDAATRGLRGLTFLGGGTGVGKSTLALFIAVHALRKHPDLGVLYYSLDMPKTVLYDRLLCQEAGVEYGDFIADTSNKAIETRLTEAEQRLQKDVLPRLRIVDRLIPQKGQLLSQVIKEDLDWLLVLGTVKEVLIIVDYFQLLPIAEDVNNGVDSDFYRVKVLQRVQEASRTNQNPIGFPILAISEVRKGESGRTEISIGDLMGSARLGYSAESVLLLESPQDDKEGSVVPVTLKVVKGRDGAVRTQIKLLFEHTLSRFKEAPRSGSTRQGSKPKKQTPAPKSDQGKIDPLAGLEN